MKKFEKVFERDIDLYILNKFVNDEKFKDIFLNVLGAERCDIVDFIHSYSDENGESDITVVLKNEKETIGLLIEDKISAIAMPNQYERYLKRGDRLAKEGLFDRFFVFIIAPESYLKENAEAKKYDYQISYETILEYIKDDLFGKELIKEAINEKKKGYLMNDFVERIEYIICKDENTELGSIYLKKNDGFGYISDVNNTYEVRVNAVGDMYAATTNGEEITQKWSNLVWLAIGDNFKAGETYKVKAKVIAKEGTYYADSEAYMTNSTFTTVEPKLTFNTTNLKNAKIVTEAPTNIEKDFHGYELAGGVYIEQVDNRVNNVLTVRQEGSYYSTACMIVGDKVTFYVYSGTAGQAKIILNTASGNVGSYIDGTPNSVEEVILKNSFSVKFNGNDLTLNDNAKAEAYKIEFGSWSVCQHFVETELATATVKKGWNAIQFVYEKGAQANLGDIRFEFVA